MSSDVKILPENDHPLLVDTTGEGVWGWIDRTSEKISKSLNPILIKEARQALKSKQFAVTFFLLLLASWVWMILGVVSMAPDIYFVPSGKYLMTGYYFLLAIPMMAMVPLSAHRSLAAELDEGTYELLAITKLSSLRIVSGKLGSALLQMLVYFAALVPSLTFCYLLRGVDMPMIAATIALVFAVSILLSTFALLLATAVQNRAGQIFTVLALLAVILFSESLCAAFILGVVFEQQIYWEWEAIVFTFLFGLVTISCMVMFVRAASARIAPVTENRSTVLRWIMFAQQLIWIASIATLGLWYEDYEPVNFGIMILGGYWLVMGMLMLGESAELSPRVLRTLPKTKFGRMMLLWFCPGPGTGFMFATTSGIAGMFSLGFVSLAFSDGSNVVSPVLFAVLMTGYLLMYLGATRLIVLPLARRFGISFVLPCSVMLGLLMLGIMFPSILMVVTTGSPSTNYGSQEFTNWIWTLDEAFSYQPNPVLSAGFLAFTTGLVFFVLNLFLLIREFSYRRVSVPQRVIQVEAENETSIALDA